MSQEKKAPLPDLLSGIGPVLDRYDGFILDVWGVLHDGVDPYDGVVDALKLMRAAGKKVYLLSNSPLRVERMISHALEPKGLTRDLFTGAITSGEVALEHMLDQWNGAKIYRLWPDEHESALVAMPHEHVTDINDADVIFGALIPNGQKPDSYDDILRRAADKNIPMVCANPDRVVNKGAEIHYVTGTYAERYAAIGGSVTWFGKPYRSIYDRLISIMDVPHDRILAVGDSLHTDVAGANNAGIDVAWNLPGIHWEEVRASGPLAKPNPIKLAAALTNGNARPTYMLMGLVR